mgnify:CR=1 FL=1
MVTWEITAFPLHGTAIINGGDIEYDNDPGYTGSDYITYRQIVDGVAQIERRICITVV